jgi:hypothetical protein
MEQKICELIETEVRRRTQLTVATYLEVISGLYDIPPHRLIKDTVHLDVSTCKGINKEARRCLKTPLSNGYCKFHRRQAPEQEEPPPPPAPSPAPWDA